MALSEARKGEIALRVLKAKIQRDGVRIGPHLQREIANEAKKLGISPEEAREFMADIVYELVESTFGKRV
jgi:hypothetical protein